MKEQNTLLHDETLVNKIYFIRGQKVMLDRAMKEHKVCPSWGGTLWRFDQKPESRSKKK